MADKSDVSDADILRGTLFTIARGGALILVGSFFSILVNFAYQFILARLLGPSEVGIVNLGISVITLVSLVMIFGLDRAIVRYVAYYLGQEDRQRELGVITSVFRILGTCIFIILPLYWVLSPYLASQVFHKPELLVVLRILGLGLPFIALTRVLLGFTQAYKLMRPYFIIEQITIPTMRVAGLFLMVLLIGATSPAAAMSYSFAVALGCIPAFYYFRITYRQRRRSFLPKGVTREVIQYAFLAMLSIILNRTNTQTETLVLGAFSSSEQVGIYTVGLKATVFISIFLDAMAIVFTPFVAELYAKKDTLKLSEQLKTVTRWSFTLALPVAIILFIESPDLMALLGPDFAPGVPVLRILVIAQLAYVVLGPGSLMLMMTDYNRLNMFNSMLNLAVSLGLDLTLIPRYGAIGAAVAGAITIVFVNLLRLFQVRVTLGMHPYSWHYLKPILAGLGATILAVIAVNWLADVFYLWRLFAISGIVLLVYSGLILALRLEKTDRELFQSLLYRFGRQQNSV